MHNTSAHTDKQHQVAAARRMLRAGGLQRLTTALERCESRLSVCRRLGSGAEADFPRHGPIG
jgi:hypothetical protein